MRSKPKQELQEALAKSQVFTAGTGGKKEKKKKYKQVTSRRKAKTIYFSPVTNILSTALLFCPV